jgi:hypothetical protein
MASRHLLIHSSLLALLLATWAETALSQQTIANPLIRPARMEGNTPAASGGQAAEEPGRASEQGHHHGGAGQESGELRRQAERRITQEDLNIRQQTLNSPVLPLPLQALFANMQVTAHFQGAIVMRKVDNDFSSPQFVPATQAQSGNNRAEASPATAQVSRPISRSSGVLRLRVGRTENVSGYSLRAMVNGQDITVDWLSDQGTWVNVFFGALESSTGGVPQVPTESQLQKVETDKFKHLVPVLRTQTFSPSGTLGGQQSGGGLGGGGFGSGNGTNQGFNQPGFGTGFPN